MTNFKFSTLFIFVMAQPISADWISATSRLLFSGQCQDAACSGNTFSGVKECTDTVLISQLFREIAEEQKTETQCEFDYLSQYDQLGFNDYKRACGRAGATAGLSQSVALSLGPNTTPNNFDVYGRQLMAVSQILHAAQRKCEFVRQLESLRPEFHRHNCDQKPSGSSWKYQIGPSLKCNELAGPYQKLKAQVSTAHLNSWNGESPVAKEYFDMIYDRLDGQCQMTSEAKKKLIDEALNPAGSLSFQKRVIERGKTLACQTLKFMEDVERNPNVMNADDMSQSHREYRSFLTTVALSKMQSDEDFRSQYHSVQCRLEVDYGKHASRVFTAAQGGSLVLGLAQPFVARAAGRLILARVGQVKHLTHVKAMQTAGGILAMGGIQIANAHLNLAQACASGAPDIQRTNICAQRNMANLTEESLKETEFHQRSTNECATGVLIELAGLVAAGKGIKDITDVRNLGITPASLKRNFGTAQFFKTSSNGTFIQSALKNEKRGVFFDMENIVLKELNDQIFKDKELATVVTNLQKSAVAEAIEQSPVLKANIIDAYSDFKSVRLIFNPDGKVAGELDRLYSQVQLQMATLFEHKDFQRMLNQEGVRNMARSSSNWFRAGAGRSADEAGSAARQARGIDGAAFRLTYFSDPEVQKILSSSLSSMKTDIGFFKGHDDWVKSGLLTPTANGNIPSTELLAIIRKQTHSRDNLPRLKALITREIKEQFKIDPNQEEIDRVFRLFQESDRFMPGISLSERVTLNLTKSKNGFIMGDFSNVGAKNISALLEEVAGAKNVDDAMIRARASEKKVTQILEKQRQEVHTFQNRHSQRFDSARVTGDDTVLFVKESAGEITPTDLVSYLRETPSDLRAVAISPRTVNRTRFNMEQVNMLSVEADQFHKELTQMLHKKISVSEGKNVRLGLFVRPSESGTLKGSAIEVYYQSDNPHASQAILEIYEELAKKYGLFKSTPKAY